MTETGPTWVSGFPTPEDALAVWTLYDKTTTDFPGVYVLRKHLVLAEDVMATNEKFTCEDLDPLIEQAEMMGLVGLAPNEGDDPVILGSFI